MSKFKVGDVVRRKTFGNPGFAYALGRYETYTVTAVSSEGLWIAVNDWNDNGQDLFPWSARNFELYTEQDDPLPPAPESVMYVNKWRWAVGVRNLGDEVQIGTGNPNSCNHGWTYATLDPDAALQLAHDLNRMANEIKRKEKQNG